MSNIDCLYCQGAIVASEKYKEMIINVCLYGHRTAYELDNESDHMIEDVA